MMSRAPIVAVSLFCLAAFFFTEVSKVVVDHGLQSIRHKREWARHKGFFMNPDGTDLVFFLGNSYIVMGIIPEAFDRENSCVTYSYNMALPALPLAPQYFMLKEYLKNNKAPRYIVMLLTPGGFRSDLFPGHCRHGAGLFEVAQYAILAENPQLLIDYIMPWRRSITDIKIFIYHKFIDLLPKKAHDIMNHYYPGYVNPESLSKRHEEALLKNRGYLPYPQRPSIGNARKDPRPSKKVSKGNGRNPDYDPFVDKFFQLTRRKGIKVMLISGYFKKGEREQIQAVPALWEGLRKKYDNVYFANEGYKVRFYDPEYFADTWHLNEEGAEIYTKDIAGEFKSVFKPE